MHRAVESECRADLARWCDSRRDRGRSGEERAVMPANQVRRVGLTTPECHQPGWQRYGGGEPRPYRLVRVHRQSNRICGALEIPCPANELAGREWRCGQRDRLAEIILELHRADGDRAASATE